VNNNVIPPTPTPSSTAGCLTEDFPAAPAGPSIALIQRGGCDFAVKVDNAVTAGYDAVIIFNEGQPGRDGPIGGTLGNPKPVPVVDLSFADGAEIYAATQAGTVNGEVSTSTKNEVRSTFNIIADSPKGKKADEVVVVGAHLDSVAAGPGINDNGSGTATVLEIAKQMSALGFNARLQRKMRYAFWGAEEANLVGSTYYVNNLDETRRSHIYANLNFDMLGSPNYARLVYDGDGSDTGTAGPDGSGAIERLFLNYFKARGLASEPTAFDGRSDYGPFIDVGIPAGGLFSGAEGIKTPAQVQLFHGTAGVAFDKCYHQACDTIDNLNPKALNELGDAAAHVTLVLALSKSGLYPDGSRMAAKSAAKRTGTATEQRGHAVIR
jgi:Zn-dependent M28 family amino/carboxypeptidase